MKNQLKAYHAKELKMIKIDTKNEVLGRLILF